MANTGLPLEGIRVIEYANYVAAPVTGRLLADWGAEVIKVEPLSGDSMRFVGMQWNFPIDDEENPLKRTLQGLLLYKKGMCHKTKK